MKKRKFFLSLMTGVALVATGYLGMQTFSNSENEYSSLLLQNIEALSDGEESINVDDLYGYRLLDRYEKEENPYTHKIEKIFKGRCCMQDDPNSICNRKQQSGDCKKS